MVLNMGACRAIGLGVVRKEDTLLVLTGGRSIGEPPEPTHPTGTNKPQKGFNGRQRSPLIVLYEPWCILLATILGQQKEPWSTVYAPDVGPLATYPLRSSVSQNWGQLSEASFVWELRIIYIYIPRGSTYKSGQYSGFHR